jgi:hypothetical protein
MFLVMLAVPRDSNVKARKLTENSITKPERRRFKIKVSTYGPIYATASFYGRDCVCGGWSFLARFKSLWYKLLISERVEIRMDFDPLLIY